MNKLQDNEYLSQIHNSMEEIGGIIQDRHGDPIPHIEGWTAGDVIGHTGWVARFIKLSLEASTTNPPSRSSVSEPPLSDSLLPWFSEARTDLLEAFENTDLDLARPTFTGPQTGRWWLRRFAHETAMHRWDAASASGSPVPIDPDLARDGIDEVLEVFASIRLDTDVLAGKGETIHLHATDIDDGEWMITLNSDGISVEHGHAKGDVAARGPVSDLLLLLWSRIPPTRLEVFGDSTLLERWQEAATF